MSDIKVVKHSQLNMSGSYQLIYIAFRIDTCDRWHCKCPIYETKTTSFIVKTDQLMDMDINNRSTNLRVQTKPANEIDFNCGCR